MSEKRGNALGSESRCVLMSGEKFFQQTRILTQYLLLSQTRTGDTLECHGPTAIHLIHGSVTRAFNMRQLHLSH